MSDTTPIRDHYRWFVPVTTRWMDNDLYGHVNNVIYYSWFDTVANRFLIEEGGLDIHQGDVIAYIVHSQCHYLKAVAFPQSIEAGFRVERIGNSSVQYGIAIFREGEDDCCAWGTFTHVFVNRNNERPTPIPAQLRQALEAVLVKNTQES